MLNNKDLKELISVTRQHIQLPEAVIEKDYYVTRAIHALSGTENEYFRLVFAGGTCLAKAHKIVKRMSEDIDFKIHIKKIDENFSKTRLLKELKEFRSQISSQLILPDLIAGEPRVRNEGKYSRVELKYAPTFPVSASLRTHILLEFTVSDVRLSIEDLSIRTLIEDTLENMVIFKPSFTQCVSVEETAIEKWVGLTRRMMAIEREYHPDDKTLVRHVYDLNAIKHADKINASFFDLAKAIVSNDAAQFKNQHPEYSVNPADEIRQSLESLKTKPIWKERYQEFIETMVYDNTSIPEYEKAIQSLEGLSEQIIKSLSVS